MNFSELSRSKRLEFLSDRFVRRIRKGSRVQKAKRAARKHRYQYFLAARFAKNRLDRHGFVPDGVESPEHKRRMRNARKQERAL